MPRTRTRVKRTRTKNSKKRILLVSCVLLLTLFFISIIFSIINMGNKRIIKGVKIGDIDVSNLTQEEAKEKVTNWYENVVLSDVEAKYEDMKETISIKQIGNTIDIDKLVREATVIGRKGNIIRNNYEILFTLLFSKKIETNIELNSENIEKEIKEITSKIPNIMIDSDYYIEENNLIIKKGKKGVQINKEAFKQELNKTILKEENREFIIPVKEVNPTEIDIEQIHREIYKEAKNASISENPIKVEPEINGVDFAITVEEARELLNEEKEEYSIPLNITMPDVTLAKLGTKAFPEKLGEFETVYSTENANRVTNLQLASEKVNGTIVLPGEIFSYNKVVGARTIAKGYKEAAVYAGGKVVNGIGGGICQLSSTLYNAALYANMEITQRANHMFLTSYVPVGRDATVSWGTLDFCFKNTRKYPIKIVSIVKNGVVTTGIYGIKEEKEYEILIESRVTENIPYTTRYVKDYTMNEGKEEIKQYGSNGAKSETYKIVKDGNDIISTTLISTDEYSPLERIIKKGTKKVQGVNSTPVEETNSINPEILDTIRELE